MHWSESLHFKLTLCQLCLLVVMIGSTIAVMFTVERSLLIEEGKDLAEQLGNRVVSDLETRTALAESLTTSLANLGEKLGTDVDTYKNVMPHVIDYEGNEDFIAGGGIWPEPNAFSPGVERRSFFWGREPNGTMKYFDDYNDPAGRGYHKEEWYVPATHYPPGKSFWSKSYVDPHSQQPMVTCTVPMHNEGRLAGVATVDLKLEGLGAMLHDASDVMRGYMFLVDRNNKFLTFPDLEVVTRNHVDDDGHSVVEFLTASDVAQENTSFSSVADALAGVNRRILEAANLAAPEATEIVRDIEKRSDQISREEARLIVAVLNDPLGEATVSSNEIERLFLDDCLLFDEPIMVSIFHMPTTYWKLIVVTPMSKFYAPADAATLKVGSYVIGLELSALLIMFFVSKRLFIRPLRRLSDQLRKMSASKDNFNERLCDTSQSELGQLAYHFNRRTDFLFETLNDLENARDQLEDRVTERTATLESTMTALQDANSQLIVAKDAAEVASKCKTDFLANMSHEIRTPMTAILGFSENLLDTSQSEQERLNCIHIIRCNGAFLLDLINDILDLSKIEAGKMTIERTTCEPCRIIAEVASLMSVRADAKSLSFDLEYEGAIPATIQSDPTRIRQILINLVGNAIKFTETGSVRLVTRLVHDHDVPHLRFDVIDTGCGMTQCQKSTLFQAFTQADSSITRQFGGSGLGLYISKRFAEMLGGDITVAATEKGAGSTFRVTVASGTLDGVCLHDDAMSMTVIADSANIAPEVSQVALPGCRILLAEDNVVNRVLIVGMFKKLGAEVIVAENGELALNAAMASHEKGDPFDVILMDMQMPVMDGYEATERLRQKGYTGPIIALTAHAMASDREKCIQAGCTDFATKPINRAKLIETIRQHLVPVEAASQVAG